MSQLTVESDGIVFGHTANEKRTYKSLNYHRQAKQKRGKTIWATAIKPETEYAIFEESEVSKWLSSSGDYWWVSKGAKTIVGLGGERLAFFPFCSNHPGPWHGYPVSPSSDPNYEVPKALVDKWEDDHRVNDVIAGRIRKGKI